MTRTLRYLVLVSVAGLFVAASTPITGCGGSGGEPSGLDEDLCDLFSFSNNPATISLQDPADCGGSTGGFSNHVFDQFGRVLSFNFDIQCSAGDTPRLLGRVFNVQWNNLGEIVSLQATINGRSCSLP